MTFILLVIYALAIMRLTRLINADSILDRPRLAIIARAREAEWLTREAAHLGQDTRARLLLRSEQRWRKVAYFIQCPWCVSMWWALATAPLLIWVLKYGWTLDWWAVVPIALATSHVVGVCARFADTEEIDVEDADADQ